jgi:hypothetical protein
MGSVVRKPDIIDGLFPVRRVHLIAGPVGVGKTTLECQAIECIQLQTPFLGFAVQPTPIWYITADRSVEEHLETCERLNVSMEGVKVISTDSYPTIPLLREILESDKKGIKGAFVIVEPLPFFLVNHINQPGNINDPVQVARFLCTLKRLCGELDITILGSCHSSKAKEGSGYAMIREKISGCSSWGGYTSTNIVIDPTEPGDPTSPFRTVYLLYRNRPNCTIQFQLDARGRFVPTTPGKSSAWAVLDKQLLEWPVTKKFSNSDIEFWQEMAGCARATAFRWVDSKIEDGLIERIERGVYQRPQKRITN